MGAKIDAKVEHGQIVFKNWWMEPSTTQYSENCWKKVLRRMVDNNCDENEPWLSINDPNMKESKWQSRLVTLLCEDLHERMQHYMRQHFAYRCQQHAHPGGPTSWR